MSTWRELGSNDYAAAEVAMLNELLDGAYELLEVNALDLAFCREIFTHYSD